MMMLLEVMLRSLLISSVLVWVMVNLVGLV